MRHFLSPVLKSDMCDTTPTREFSGEGKFGVPLLDTNQRITRMIWIIYHGSNELTYLNKRIRKACPVKIKRSIGANAKWGTRKPKGLKQNSKNGLVTYMYA